MTQLSWNFSKQKNDSINDEQRDYQNNVFPISKIGLEFRQNFLFSIRKLESWD